ncbi:DUF3310 domain-containing protein [Streptomyces cacaoi]|uniref:DUF3310 domain-containing protein n=1 Tax=Streptomyces cacaoi TaxID=1898 RepID=A0A4Y3R0V6_STRCI|nr:DUF3310 domain-containing protein [Streptomyces cacaoi]GEB50403.1 hypothetical protein SCA03_29540 [Streptomyces cacaoi]
MAFVENDWVTVSNPRTLAARMYAGRTGCVVAVEDHPYPYLVEFDGGGRLAFAGDELRLSAFEDDPCQPCPHREGLACCAESQAREADFDDEHLTNGRQVDDPVKHPAHYTSYRGIEVIQLTEQMNFNRGNAIKYLARAGLKDPDTELQDLEKAAWYIGREKQRVQGVRA